MRDKNDIVWISVPFVAGTGAAAAMDSPSLTGAVSLAAVALCMLAAVHMRGKELPVTVLLFLSLGIFCWSSRAVFANFPVHGAGVLRSLAGDALTRLSEVISRIPFPHTGTGPLLRALLTGQRDLLGRDTVGAFRSAGASHILALSGLHLGVIYLILSRLLGIFGNSRAAWALRSALIIALSAFYVAMTGASPSIVRAFLFITMTEIARHCPGRRKTAISVWCTALLLQLSFSPESVSSIGFQLSYLAMLGIFTLFPFMKAWYPGIGGKAPGWDLLHRAWDAMALSISCQMFTAPLVWVTFHTFPKYFLLTNLIAMPLTGALMGTGIATVVLEALPLPCPPALVRLTDLLSTTLIRSLGIIASM